MKNAIFACVAFATGLAGTAWAQERYVSFAVQSGGSFDYSYALPTIAGISDARIQVDADTGVGPVATYGQTFGAFRAEVGLSHLSRDLTPKVNVEGLSVDLEKKGKTSTTSLEAIGYYDFPVKGRVQPYVGLGAGIAKVKIDDGLVDDSVTTALVQGILGVSAHAGKSVSIFGDVRVSRVGTITVETKTSDRFTSTASTDVDFTSTDFRIGLRKSF